MWYYVLMDGGLVHVLNRGVEKRDVVLDDADRIRFVHDLYIFNDVNTVDPNHRFVKTMHYDRTPLVRIHAWCLMNNHYHLLLSDVVENGISRFMQKVSMGYAKYFNERYSRMGALWQGRTKKVPITREAHFLYIPYYIHLNSLDYILPEWRSGHVEDVAKAFAALDTYRWSSHLDYSGKVNFPSLLYRSEIAHIIQDADVYRKTIADLISGAHHSAPNPKLEW
jgi:putative transposase